MPDTPAHEGRIVLGVLLVDVLQCEGKSEVRLTDVDYLLVIDCVWQGDLVNDWVELVEQHVRFVSTVEDDED